MSEALPIDQFELRVGRCTPILNMSVGRMLEFINSFDLCILGCDGVLWKWNEPIERVTEAVHLLQTNGKSIKFVTNNSLSTDEELINRLEELNILDVMLDDIISPAKSIMRFIKKHYDNAPLFSLCNDKVNIKLIKEGIPIVTMPPHFHVTTNEFLYTLKTKDSVKAVLLDLNLNIDFSQLAKAYEYLKKDDCALLVGGIDLLYPVADSFNILGMHGFVKLLSDCSGKDPIIVGKPGSTLINNIMEDFHIEKPSRVLFIGDNIKTDIKLGIHCGFQTLLVFSGVSNEDNLHDVIRRKRPDYIAQSISDFIEFFNFLDSSTNDVTSGSSRRASRLSTRRSFSRKRDSNRSNKSSNRQSRKSRSLSRRTQLASPGPSRRNHRSLSRSQVSTITRLKKKGSRKL